MDKDLQSSDLGKSLEKAVGLLLPQDFDDDQHEVSPILFAGIRQKDLKGDDGKVIRPAGGFRFGSTKDATHQDRDSLLVTILGFKKSRVFFRSLTDASPTCKSDDMIHGSSDPDMMDGHAVYGRCDECFLSKWGSADNGRQACRENRRIFAIDWSNERPIVLTIGPSSLRGWIQYDDFVSQQARKVSKDGKVPFIHHLIQVSAKTEYRSEPAGHYVVRWESPGSLPREIQERMAAGRSEAMERFRNTERTQEYEPEDYVGRSEDNGGEE